MFKRLFTIGLLVAALFGAYRVFLFKKKPEFESYSNVAKSIVVNDNGLVIGFSDINEENVGDFLISNNIELGEFDEVFPSAEDKLVNQSVVQIQRAKMITIKDKDEEHQIMTLSNRVADVFLENDFNLGEFDIIEPEMDEYLVDGSEIEVTRVEIKELVLDEKIKYKTKTEEDDEMGWQEEKVVQKGVDGVKQNTYKQVIHNGKEISRKLVGSEVTKEPVMEIVKKGTYVKLGKKHSGFATWYDQGPHPKLRARYPFEGAAFAANPWLPLGSYVKVTNKANGKSIIVRINDRGPFGENRILDLNKPAFAKIASIGAGVIDIKMEEIKN